MIQYRYPVRRNQLVLLRYTFKDQDKPPQIIDLSPYTGGVFVEIKQEGQIFLTVDAALDSVASTGKVKASYAFPAVGIWNYQFYVLDGSGKPLWGEPIQIRVVKNVEDLSLDELPPY